MSQPGEADQVQRSAKLWAPDDVGELVGPVSRAVGAAFVHSHVDVVPCPDLRQHGLAFEGLGGSPELADVGGVDNLHYAANNGVAFGFDDVAK